MSTFHAQILTPEGAVFEGEVTGVKMPGTLGSFEVKFNHAPIVSTLTEGDVLVRVEKNSDKHFNITGGFVEVNQNNLTLLAESATEAWFSTLTVTAGYLSRTPLKADTITIGFFISINNTLQAQIGNHEIPDSHIIDYPVFCYH